ALRSPGQRGSDTEYAELNEQQSTLILTYMRNTLIVRDFKKKLVKAFWELAHKQYTPTICCVCHNHHHHLQEQKVFQSSCPCSDKLQNIEAAIRELQNYLTTNHHQSPPSPKVKSNHLKAILPFLNAWWDCLGNREITASDLCRMINDHQCQTLTKTATALFGLENNLTGRKLAATLRLWTQDDFGNFSILNTGHKTKQGILWKLERDR
ncbi:hypothetical protein TI05_13110, partial [Achromatium sp. WMS3]